MKTFLLMAALLAPVSAVQTTTGMVSGEIRTAGRTAAVGVRVSAMAIPDAGVPANSGTALISIGVTDNQGHYKTREHPPGTLLHYGRIRGPANLLSGCVGDVRCNASAGVGGNSSHQSTSPLRILWV
jgi:hypothetical protein